MLGAIESLLSAVVADRMSGDRHDPNVELTAQGIANVLSPLFGGLPATGAIARTATNIRSGARTPVAGMTHAVTLLLVLLFAAPLARHIPLAMLAGILMIVRLRHGRVARDPGRHQAGPGGGRRVGHHVRADRARRPDRRGRGRHDPRGAALHPPRDDDDDRRAGDARVHRRRAAPTACSCTTFRTTSRSIRIHGPFLFGSTDKLLDLEREVASLPRVVILRLRNMTAIDGTGLHALEQFADVLHASGRTLLLCGMRDQPARMMERAEFHQHIGDENLLPSVEAALERARTLREGPIAVERAL